MYGGHMFGWGGAMFGGIGMLFWWIALIVIVVIGARYLWSGGSARPAQSGSSALDILKERYAKGEINKQEFEERKATLMK
jgi:putative membrane protein